MITGCSQTGDTESSQAAKTKADKTAEVTVTETSAPVTTTFKKPEEYGKVIALTFDDGPNTTATSMILDTLEKYGARASFFLIGDNINDESARSVRRAVELGCEINSHSRTHSYMDKMSADDIIAEMEYTDEKIEAITGVTPRFFRPPYIAVSDTMYEVIDKPFICGLGCDDWDDKVSAETITESVLAQAEDGAIILLHDAKDNFRTPEAIETIVPELQKQGYELVTVSELFYAKGVEPVEDNVLYSRALQTGMY